MLVGHIKKSSWVRVKKVLKRVPGYRVKKSSWVSLKRVPGYRVVLTSLDKIWYNIMNMH